MTRTAAPGASADLSPAKMSSIFWAETDSAPKLNCATTMHDSRTAGKHVHERLHLVVLAARGRIATAAIDLPVIPRSARCENSKSVRHAVQSGDALMFFAETPAIMSCCRFASTKSRKIFFGNSLCPGARALKNSNGYFSRIGSDSLDRKSTRLN